MKKFWDRPYRLRSFPRDLTPNERESYKFLAGQVNYFGLNHELLEENLATIGERGAFTNPMSLFKRMAEMLPGFEDAGAQILSAMASDNLVLEIRSLPATLVVLEIFLDYHWKITGKPALVNAISLSGKSQLKLREWATDMISPSVDWETIVAAVYLDPTRVRKLKCIGTGVNRENIIRETYAAIMLPPGEINANALYWHVDDELREAILEPRGTCKKTSVDPVVTYIRNRQNGRGPVSIDAF